MVAAATMGMWVWHVFFSSIIFEFVNLLLQLLKFACPEPPPQSTTHGKEQMKSSKGGMYVVSLSCCNLSCFTI
jgi:hypothetical protein